MTTNNRMSRFDQDLLDVIELSGSVDNPYLTENGVIRSKIGSNNPNRSLTSFVVKFDRFSNDKISEIYNTEFSEFVEESETVQQNVIDQEELNFLRRRLEEITAELDSLRELSGSFTTVISPVTQSVVISPTEPTITTSTEPIVETSNVEVQDAETIGDLPDIPSVDIIPDTTIVTENTLILPPPQNGVEQDTDVTYDDNNNVVTPEENVTPSDPIIEDTSTLVRPFYKNPYGFSVPVVEGNTQQNVINRNLDRIERPSDRIER